MKGIIFDMDGVLFDTEKLYERFWCEAAKNLGYHMTVEDVAAVRSTDAKKACEILKKRLGEDFDYDAVKKHRIELMHNFTTSYGVELKPYVREFLDFINDEGYKIALATTSNMERATNYLKMGDIYHFFDYLLSGDRVTKGKPDPEIYEKAAKGLGLNPKECYAVEDSYNGVRSAYNAGCRVIMIPDRDIPDEEMNMKTWKIVPDFNKLIKIIISGLQIEEEKI